MKLTKRQLNKIITESLGTTLPNMNEQDKFGGSKLFKKAIGNVNFSKVRTLLSQAKSQEDPSQKMLDDLEDAAAVLLDIKSEFSGDPKYDDPNKKSLVHKRYREAMELNAALVKYLDGQSDFSRPDSTDPTEKDPKKVKDVTDEPIIKKPPEPSPDPKPNEPTPWNPDPDPKVGWEYQVRECIWYTRKKETTKEYKLGHASGKPLEKGGKFFNSIVELNNTYPDLVKDCDPVKVKKKKEPTPKPAGKGSNIEVKYFKASGGVTGLRAKVMTELVTAFSDFKSDSTFETLVNNNDQAYNAAQTNVLGIKGVNWPALAKSIAKIKNPAQNELPSTTAVENMIRSLTGKQTHGHGKIVDVLPKVIYYALPETGSGLGYIFLFAVTTENTVGEDKKIILYKFHAGAQGNVVGSTNESLSRGALYRRHYYGRY